MTTPATIRALIFEAVDQPLKAIEVPEWKTTVYIKPFNGLQIDQWEVETDEARSPSADKTKLIGMRALLLSLTLADAEGELLFTRADVDALQKKNGKVIKRLFALAMEVNGLSDSSVDTQKKP